jgi:hypothetical protein
MTATTAVWIALAAAAATTAVRALRTRPARVPARVPARATVRTTVPSPRADVDGWHPRVTSGCGR